jgi:hypothetical protein
LVKISQGVGLAMKTSSCGLRGIYERLKRWCKKVVIAQMCGYGLQRYGVRCKEYINVNEHLTRCRARTVEAGNIGVEIAELKVVLDRFLD